jgi:A/G-specific adenine glycosylase
VLKKYPLFLKEFPTIRKLAGAPRRDVLMAWQGMGYNNRAVRLHLLARTVVEKHRGELPHDYESLIALPGVGRYTANAIRSSAFQENVPVIDVNIRRFFSRVFWRMRTYAELRDERLLWPLAEELLPRKQAYTWNQALMDIGATVCAARHPDCAHCPAAPMCRSRGQMRHPAKRKARSEPSFAGIPNRIYRGRIVEVLRDAGGKRSIAAHELGKRICPGFSPRDALWLASLLEGLKEDGLIAIRGKGEPSTCRIAFA